MKLLILNKLEAEANTGEYIPFHEVQPLKITDDFYILNRDLSEAKGLESYRDAILVQPYFTKGDGSKFDLKYQEYLDNQSIEV